MLENTHGSHQGGFGPGSSSELIEPSSTWVQVICQRPQAQERLENETDSADYLVNFVASNIWRIWIREQHRVVRVRDVVFDDTSKFDPNELPSTQKLATEMRERIEAVELWKDTTAMNDFIPENTCTDSQQSDANEDSRDEKLD